MWKLFKKFFKPLTQKPLKIIILASGRGSNFIALHEAIIKKQLQAEIVMLISDKPKAPALKLAQERGIRTQALDYHNFNNKQDYEIELFRILKAEKFDYLILAGYMRILGKEIVQAFKQRIINIHPSLLPSFKGLHPQRQALQYGVKISGCTIHFVDEGVDTGPIILQRAVEVLPDDTEASLAKRILAVEHQAYPQALALLTKKIEAASLNKS